MVDAARASKRADRQAVFEVFSRSLPGRRPYGVVAGTGLQGFRLTERIPYFRSGVHYPDLVVFGAESLTPGTEGLDGIRAAAFFENDWTLGDDFDIREQSTKE